MRTSLTRMRAVLLATALLSTAVIASAGETASAEVLLVDRLRSEVGPLGPISVLGDSVLLGSAYFGPTLDDQLISRGWGPVRIRAGVGNSTGKFTNKLEVTAPYWIKRWRAEGWDPVDIVVNLGANDSATCEGDFQCSYDAIMYVVDAIGPGHRIWWPKITRYPYLIHHQTGWNAALDQIVRERDDFFTWDWPPIMYAENLYASDYTHLTVAGYRRRSFLMAEEITADLGRAHQVASNVTLPQPVGGPSEVVPIGPLRVLDTRKQPPGRIAGGGFIQVDVSDDVPDGTTAVAVYLTAALAGGRGHLTAWDCAGPPPTTSVANYDTAGARGAVAITPVNADGKFCLFSFADADVIVDLQAAFVPLGTGSRFTPLAQPSRLANTRDTGRTEILTVAVPGDVDMAAVTVTAIRADAPGHLVVYPCTAEVPTISNVNYGAGEVVAGTAFVPTSDEGTICVYAKSSVDVTVDLTGTFTADGDLVFLPAPPTRTINTRNGIGGWTPLHGQFQTIEAKVAPSNARAVSGTIVLVNPMRNGHLRAYGCGDLPPTASVTADAGVSLANSLTTGVTDGKMCVYSAAAATTVFDTTGWWVTP